MQKSKQLVSIGFPVRNGEAHIRQAIGSLLAQEYENFELIISDNNSTDRTQEICMEFAAADKRVQYFRSKANRGAIWNFNHVFELSHGDYFMWASHDDYWDSKYIHTCMQGFNSSADIVLVGSICQCLYSETNQMKLIDKGFSTIGVEPWRRFVNYKSIIHSGTHIGGIFYGIYRKSALEKVLPMREILAADHLIVANLCLNGEVATIQKPLLFKRWGGASVSFKKMAAAVGVKNQFLIAVPYLVREYYLQKIILKNNHLPNLTKVKLAVWSFHNYFIINIIKMIYLELKTSLKIAAIKFGFWNWLQRVLNRSKT